jgi:hypothetical protein
MLHGEVLCPDHMVLGRPSKFDDVAHCESRNIATIKIASRFVYG